MRSIELLLPDREGVVNRFVLRRCADSPVPRWETHGIVYAAGNDVFPFGMARWVHRPTGRACTVAPSDSTKHPIEVLEVALDRAGVRAEHLTGEEAWPK